MAAPVPEIMGTTTYNTKLINDDILKNTSNIVCSAIDSFKKDYYLKMALCG
jgi:hypothetical protein